MDAEFKPVVSCNGSDCMSIREQHPYDNFSQWFRAFILWGSLRKNHVGTSFGEGSNGTFTILAEYGVHLLVAKACAVCLRRTLMDTHTVKNVLDRGGRNF